MKAFTQVFLFLFCFATAFAQQVPEYKYVHVPKKFADFKTNNQYNLNHILSVKLQDKNYQVIEESRENWPAELYNNPCQVVNAELEDDSNLFRNRVKLVFKDCQGKVLSTIPASSNIKDFHQGFQDALLQTIALVPASVSKGERIEYQSLQAQANENSSDKKTESKPQVTTTPQSTVQVATSQVAKVTEERNTELPVQAQTKTVTVTNNQTVSAVANSAVEKYKNGDTVYTKVNLSPGYFIFTSPNSSTPYATFRETTRKGIYRVELANKTVTTGYDDNQKITVEIPQEDGQLKAQEFLKQ